MTVVQGLRTGLLALGMLGMTVTAVRAQDAAEIEAIIADRAAAHGVDAGRLQRVAWCESRYNPRAVGDQGSSVGLFQLHERGLRPLFFRWGYDDVHSAWQQADFTARAFAAGLSAHWTCAR